MKAKQNEETQSFTNADIECGNKYDFIIKNKMGSSSLKKKFKFCTSSFCAAGLAVACTVVITILILMTKISGPGALELAEAEISRLGGELYVCNSKLSQEGSGEGNFLSDDEDVNLRHPTLAKRAMDSMVGEWKQVRTENMVEYMTAEGNKQFDINMAQKFNPNMEIRDDGNGKFTQKIYASFFYSEEWPWNLDGKMTEFENFFKEKVHAVVYDDGKKVTSTNMGGSRGPQINSLELINDEIHLTTILTEKNFIKSVRVFKRV